MQKLANISAFDNLSHIHWGNVSDISVFNTDGRYVFADIGDGHYRVVNNLAEETPVPSVDELQQAEDTQVVDELSEEVEQIPIDELPRPTSDGQRYPYAELKKLVPKDITLGSLWKNICDDKALHLTSLLSSMWPAIAGLSGGSMLAGATGFAKIPTIIGALMGMGGLLGSKDFYAGFHELPWYLATGAHSPDLSATEALKLDFATVAQALKNTLFNKTGSTQGYGNMATDAKFADFVDVFRKCYGRYPTPEEYRSAIVNTDV